MIRGPTSLFADGYPVVPAPFFEKVIISLLNGLDIWLFYSQERP
jgi:hypothetical protein